MTDPLGLDPGREPEHPSARDLELLAFDGDDLHRGSSLESHVRGCDVCRDTVHVLRADRDAFLVRRPPAAFVARLETQQSPAPRWPFAVAAVGLVAAAAAVLLVPSAPPDVRLRGEGDGLRVLVSRGDGPATPHDGRPLEAGDILRFAVTTDVAGFAMIANVDDRGRVTTYVSSSPVDVGRDHVLPGSIALDDFVGVERLFLFVSDRPLDASAVERALTESYARAEGRLDAIADVEIDARLTTVTIRKRGPP